MTTFLPGDVLHPLLAAILSGTLAGAELPEGAPAIAERGIALAEGEAVEVREGTATLRRLETLPCVESEYARRYRFDAWENPKLKR